ncbi:alpha/beta hydrolase fold domain-containing protein [Kribbella sp. NPDC056345]|uniref:alpha/beta hydrolase fold domain-containing protein n=1 Tax=Kribbella sp. NPDC056345 TaxID=3345789 RepID=UPI0035DE2028
MLVSVSAGPHRFEVIPALRYQRHPDRPPWESDLHLDLLVPRVASRTPLAIYFHGGGWRSGGRELAMYPWISPLLAANGIAAASVSCRLTTSDPFPAQLDDARAAVRWLRSQADAYNFDAGRIAVWGDSAGGHLALLLATQRPTDEDPAVQAAVARCAPTDFRGWHLADENEPGSVFHGLFGGPNTTNSRLRAAASPAYHLDLSGSVPPPILLCHGDRDETVPYSQSLDFAERVRSLGGDLTLRTIPGGHHNLSGDPHAPWTDQPWEELGYEALRFFQRHV